MLHASRLLVDIPSPLKGRWSSPNFPVIILDYDARLVLAGK